MMALQAKKEGPRPKTLEAAFRAKLQKSNKKGAGPSLRHFFALEKVKEKLEVEELK